MWQHTWEPSVVFWLTGALRINPLQTGRSRRFGFVKFEDVADATDARNAMNGKSLDDRGVSLRQRAFYYYYLFVTNCILMQQTFTYIGHLRQQTCSSPCCIFAWMASFVGCNSLRCSPGAYSLGLGCNSLRCSTRRILIGTQLLLIADPRGLFAHKACTLPNARPVHGRARRRCTP